jgi:hypothetical protein
MTVGWLGMANGLLLFLFAQATSDRHRTSKFARWFMIRKLRSGEFRLYSRKIDPKTGKRRNLGTFKSRKAAEAHERAVQYFKTHKA